MIDSYFHKRKQKKLKFKVILADIFEYIKYTLSTANFAQKFISIMSILLGFTIAAIPIIDNLYQNLILAIGKDVQNNITPVEEGYLLVDNYIAKPVGLTELTEKAMKGGKLIMDPNILSFTQKFFISIPSIGIYNLPVTPNVQSDTESIYQKVLENTLAHFKYTGLPLSDEKSNTVIYGHSASMIYNPQKNDPKLAFSFLPEIKIGDKIILDFKEAKYEYTVFRTKVVNPQDLSIISNTPNTDTLTLFTCYPLGNNSQRFIVLARKTQ